MPSRSQLARARRRVDDLHLLATQEADPVEFLRNRQADADADYYRSGGAEALALCRALTESLD